jgi:hypothetical protein
MIRRYPGIGYCALAAARSLATGSTGDEGRDRREARGQPPDELALDVLMAHLPDALAGTGVAAGLWPLHEELCKLEERELGRSGPAGCYLVIRPVSLMNPPSPEAMGRITAAVRTLAELGMLTEAQYFRTCRLKYATGRSGHYRPRRRGCHPIRTPASLRGTLLAPRFCRQGR